MLRVIQIRHVQQLVDFTIKSKNHNVYQAQVQRAVDGRESGGRHRWQAASADRLRAGIDGLSGGGKPKSRGHASGVAYEDGRLSAGRVQSIVPQSGVTACMH